MKKILKNIVINRLVNSLVWEINEKFYKQIEGLSILEIQSVELESLKIDYLKQVHNDNVKSMKEEIILKLKERLPDNSFDENEDGILVVSWT